MFEITIHVPSTVFGRLTVTAGIEPGLYTIGTVHDAYGLRVQTSLELMDEIETSIEYELQCARHEALYFSGEDPALIALYR